MDLLERLQTDMKLAMKAGQKDRLLVIRMLLSDVKNIDILPGKPTAEAVVEQYAKKLRKAAEEYVKLNKPDEVAKLQGEIAVVEEYLPKKAAPAETEKLVEAFLAANHFTEKETGQAMGAFMKAHGKEVDPAVANAAMKKALAGK
jgi:uncharacterized protein YqeY